MAEDVFIGINSQALYSKSKVYMSRAMTRKAARDFDEYQLRASLALELLGKAALSRHHPSLIVDPQHAPSLFVAAGINITTDVKTIAAKTLFERLAHLVPRFDNVYLLVAFEKRFLVSFQWLWRWLTYQSGARLIAYDPIENERRTSANRAKQTVGEDG